MYLLITSDPIDMIDVYTTKVPNECVSKVILPIRPTQKPKHIAHDNSSMNLFLNSEFSDFISINPNLSRIINTGVELTKITVKHINPNKVNIISIYLHEFIKQVINN